MTNYHYIGYVYAWDYNEESGDVYSVEYSTDFVSDIPPEEISDSDFINELKDKVRDEMELPPNRKVNVGFEDAEPTTAPKTKTAKVKKFEVTTYWIDSGTKKERGKKFSDSEIEYYDLE